MDKEGRVCRGLIMHAQTSSESTSGVDGLMRYKVTYIVGRRPWVLESKQCVSWTSEGEGVRAGARNDSMKRES